MNYLRELRPDIVKLERRLTAGLEGESARRDLVAAMIAYAHELGTTVGIVGIETEGELRCARELGRRHRARASTWDRPPRGSRRPTPPPWSPPSRATPAATALPGTS